MKSHYRWKCKTATVLTFIGAAGVVATAVTTAKQTPKALRLLKEASDEKGEELTFAEKATAMLPAYLPAIVTGSATILCIFGANILNKKEPGKFSKCIWIIRPEIQRLSEKTY
jgi:hypothetical protein